MLTAVRCLLSKLVSPLWRAVEEDEENTFYGIVNLTYIFTHIPSSFCITSRVKHKNGNTASDLTPCCFLIHISSLIRPWRHSPPAGKCGDPAVPWLRHDRQCNILHKWGGVRRYPAESGGFGELHSCARWCPRGLESCKGENPDLDLSMNLQTICNEPAVFFKL